MEEAFPVSTLNSSTKRNRESTVVFQDEFMDWNSSDLAASYSTEELRQRLKNAELEALKAKALQKRAEAAKDTIPDQVQVAEAKMSERSGNDNEDFPNAIERGQRSCYRR